MDQECIQPCKHGLSCISPTPTTLSYGVYQLCTRCSWTGRQHPTKNGHAAVNGQNDTLVLQEGVRHREFHHVDISTVK